MFGPRLFGTDQQHDKQTDHHWAKSTLPVYFIENGARLARTSHSNAKRPAIWLMTLDEWLLFWGGAKCDIVGGGYRTFSDLFARFRV